MAVTPAGYGPRAHRPADAVKQGHGLTEAVTATLILTALPVAIVWALHARGLLGSPLLEIPIAVALSLGAGWLGEVLWTRRRHPDGVVFSELLLWGWVRRRRDEHRVACAEELLADFARTCAGRSRRRSERMLRALASAIDAQDAYLDGHSRRVARHAAMIAREMGLPRREVARVRTAAAVHDVGKLNVPLAVLDKPGHLDADELALIKRHAVDGEAIVAGLGDPELSAIVRHHHERLDGAGYPDGRIGETIPIGARIVAVADTFDAITSTRSYRAAVPHQQAIEILHEVSGTQLDPTAVQAFLRHYSGRRPIVLWTSLTAAVSDAVRRLGLGARGEPLLAGKTIALMAATAAIGTGGLAIVGSSGASSRPSQAHRTMSYAGQVVPAAAAAPLPLPLTQALTGGASSSAGARHNAGAAHRHRMHRQPAATRSPRRRERLAAARRHSRIRPRYLGHTPATTQVAAPPALSSGGGTGGGSKPGSAALTTPATSAPSAPSATSATSGSVPQHGSSGSSSGGGSTASHHAGGPGSQGLLHGTGPGGAGPPGLTGQTPGLSGALPPGLTKKTH
jgi:HD-GYP domain-containing protein (c-di-GMP phosphodiesterase class II)